MDARSHTDFRRNGAFGSMLRVLMRKGMSEDIIEVTEKPKRRLRARKKAIEPGIPKDDYPTPYSMTMLFLETNPHFHPSLFTLEPACGKERAICHILNEKDFDYTGYDKYFGPFRRDFLEEKRKFPQIITNPPFSLADQFIERAKYVAEEQFAFLLPLNYFQSLKRFWIWQDKSFPLARVQIFARRMFLDKALRRDGRYYPGGMIEYAWFQWRRGHKGDALLSVLNNIPYAANKTHEKVEVI